MGRNFPAKKKEITLFYNVREEKKMIEYLKIKKAAKLLNVTSQTLRNWDKSEKMKAHRHPMNQYRLYKKSDLEKILEKIEKK